MLALWGQSLEDIKFCLMVPIRHTSLRQCDNQRFTGRTLSHSEGSYGAVVGEEGLQVLHGDSGGVGRHLLGGATGHIQDVHGVVPDNSILLIEARWVPGEGERGGGGPWGCQVQWSASRIWK